MDITIFTSFIANCLHVNVQCADLTPNSIKDFEISHCFDSSLQPMYTEEYLSYLISNAKNGIFYEMTDYVNTCLILFMFNNHYFMVGPYVKTLSSDKSLHELMVSIGLPAKIFPQLKHYYNQYPLLEYTYITDIVLAAMRAFSPMTTDYTHRMLTGFHEELEKDELVDSAENSYMEIIKRYEYENFFLEKIKVGDVDGVSSALYNSTSAFVKNSDSNIQSFYANNHEGFTVMRTLARKAAELGGCPVVQIDAITKEAIQRVNNSKSLSEVSKIQGEMVLALTKAVSDSREINKYSQLIRNIVIYINANYSRDIRLTDIANGSHVSKEHLSRLFKKETGQTITEYIAIARVNKAAEMLKSTNLSVAEISEFVGYSDNNYFVKVFKKYYKMTPSDYKRNN